MNDSVKYLNKFGLGIVLLSVLVAVPLHAREIKVDLNPPSNRHGLRSAHSDNWTWHGWISGERHFGYVTVQFNCAKGETLAPALYKGLLDYGVHMGLDGFVLKNPAHPGGFDMILRGLSPGDHTLVTYHDEVRQLAPAAFNVYVDDKLKLKDFQPTHRATNDYDVAATFIKFHVTAGKAVMVHFQPLKTEMNRSIIINGFAIDAVNPHKMAIKPAPADDDEHWSNQAPLSWTPAVDAVAHEVYLGTDSNAVALATPSSTEFKGKLTIPDLSLPKLNHMTNYFWRVDEVDAGGKITKGQVWRFRTRFLAFPTAQGYGRFAIGGRGGRTIAVTNLKDYDPAKGQAVIPGSFRAAVDAKGPRTIVFRVSGIIWLKATCPVRNPYCTIAGQTAPGDGICLANYSSGAYATHDVIIRYMHFRVGDHEQRAMDGAGMGDCNNCIIDHCSISWSSDEGTSSRNAKNITFQRNIVAEALQHSYHYRHNERSQHETHAFAGSISGDIGSYHHNLIADCTDRNWSLAGGLNQSVHYAGYLDIRNNVVYNWSARTTDGGVAELNYVNNYYKPGPGHQFVKWLLKLDPINPAWGTEKYYMHGNILEGYVGPNDNWSAFYNGPKVEREVRVNHPLYPSYVTTQSAQAAFTNVLDNVGDNFPRLDVIDRHIIADVRNGTAEYMGTRAPIYDQPNRPNYPGIIDTQSDDRSALCSPYFPWPNYKTYHVPVDSDHDGMPDAWEIAHGLNPHDPSDANGDYNHDGYTNLEKYLNSLVGEYSAPSINKI